MLLVFLTCRVYLCIIIIIVINIVIIVVIIITIAIVYLSTHGRNHTLFVF